MSTVIFLVCALLVTSASATHMPIGEQHIYAGAEDYPSGFVISTVHGGEDRHGHQARGYGHGHRDYVNEPQYVVRSPYGALLQQSESHSQYYGGGVAPLGHGHVGFYGAGIGGGDYLMTQ